MPSLPHRRQQILRHRARAEHDLGTGLHAGGERERGFRRVGCGGDVACQVARKVLMRIPPLNHSLPRQRGSRMVRSSTYRGFDIGQITNPLHVTHLISAWYLPGDQAGAASSAAPTLCGNESCRAVPSPSLSTSSMRPRRTPVARLCTRYSPSPEPPCPRRVV
jgi:hypothetical protein